MSVAITKKPTKKELKQTSVEAPAEGASRVVVNLYLDPKLLHEIDEYLHEHRHQNRQQALRALLRIGLDRA